MKTTIKTQKKFIDAYEKLCKKHKCMIECGCGWTSYSVLTDENLKRRHKDESIEDCINDQLKDLSYDYE